MKIILIYFSNSVLAKNSNIQATIQDAYFYQESGLANLSAGGGAGGQREKHQDKDLQGPQYCPCPTEACVPGTDHAG